MIDCSNYKDKFPERVTSLRYQMGKSQRDMSLSLGKNQSYMFTIESGKTLPSMEQFFYICEYLNIDPKDFFDYDAAAPREINEINTELKKLSQEETKAVLEIIKSITKYK